MEWTSYLLMICTVILCLAISAYAVDVARKAWQLRGDKPVAKKEPCAFIVVSDDEFEVPCVAMAATAFKAGGMAVAYVSRSGRVLRPDPRSFEHKESKAAAARHDSVVLRA